MKLFVSFSIIIITKIFIFCKLFKSVVLELNQLQWCCRPLALRGLTTQMEVEGIEPTRAIRHVIYSHTRLLSGLHLLIYGPERSRTAVLNYYPIIIYAVIIFITTYILYKNLFQFSTLNAYRKSNSIHILSPSIA